MTDCNFCLENQVLEGEIWFRNELFYVVSARDSFPRHAAMIIPLRHIETPFEFSKQEWSNLYKVLHKTKEIISDTNPVGFNIGWNVGAIAGQHVMHAHLHVMPRFEDDPLIGKGIRAGLKMR